MLLSSAKLDFINAKHLCPACLTGALLDGPHGGCSINVRCHDCGLEYCFAFMGNLVVTAEVLASDKPEAYPHPLVWPLSKEDIKAALGDKMKGGAFGLGLDNSGAVLVFASGPIAEGDVQTMRLLDAVRHDFPPELDIGKLASAFAAVFIELIAKKNGQQLKKN